MAGLGALLHRHRAAAVPPGIRRLKPHGGGPLSTMPAVGSLLNVQMYDVDGSNADASLVSAIHSANIHAACYVSFGTYEDWPSDASPFPASVKGVRVVG